MLKPHSHRPSPELRTTSQHSAEHDPAKQAVLEQEAEITSSLSAIYGEERDDLKVVARGGGWVTRFLLRTIIVLLVLCVLAVAGYFGYQKFVPSTRDGKPLTMSFVAFDTLQSGAPATIELNYVNQTRYPLTGVALDVNLPQGFVMKTSTPAATSVQDMIWNLGTLPGGSDGKIIIDGVWNVDVPSTTGIQALATYQPANFNAQFHDIVTKTVSTDTSTTEVVIDAPESANAGEAVVYTVHVKNTGTETLIAPQVSVILPTGFFVQKSVPVLPSGGAVVYTLPDVLANTESTIVLTGAFASDVLGAQMLTATSGIGNGQRFSPQATASKSIDVKGSVLGLTMVGNGVNGDVVTDPGSLLHVSLRIENTGDTPVSDATALLDFTADDNIPIDWKTAVFAGGKATAKGITFDTKAIGVLAPKDHVVLNLGFPLKTDLAAVSSAFSMVFSATQGGITVQATPMKVTLNSDASLSSVLRFYDNDGSPLGSGPLPPVVGQTTHYRGIWSVVGGAHGLNSVTVSATLPDGVVWDDFSTATSGTMTFDATSRVVLWTISSIPEGSTAVAARFSLSVVPVTADVGFAKNMLGKATLRAKDDLTDAVLERSVDGVTTACEGDVLVTGKGTVKQ